MTGYRFPEALPFHDEARSGRLIVFCGTDGAGKSSLVQATADLLTAWGQPAETAAQPSPFVRSYPPFADYRSGVGRERYSYRAISMLVMADKLQHCDHDLAPQLRAGRHLVLDRYVFSGLVRLAMYGDPNEAWFADACALLPRPDLTVLVTAHPDVLRARLAARDYERTSDLEFREAVQVQDLLLALAPANRMLVVDTTASDTATTMAGLEPHLRRAIGLAHPIATHS